MVKYIKRIIMVLVFVLPFIVAEHSFYPYVFMRSLVFEGGALVLGLLWVIGKLYDKDNSYTFPRNIMMWVLGIYVLILLISGLHGFVPVLSFWGSVDHGTGVVFMLCLLIFTLVTSSVFRSIEDYTKLFGVMILSGIVFTIGTFMAASGVEFYEAIDMTAQGGFTIGNSSWAGVYIAFIFFISLGLAFSSINKKYKILGIIGAVTSFLDPNLTGFVLKSGHISADPIGWAQTASYSMWFSIGVFILYIIFRKIKKVKWKNIFTISVFILFFIGLFISFKPIHNLILEKAGPNRFVFWNIAVQGFKERPLLGWGGDSYSFIYGKYFDPMTTVIDARPEYWVDRAHNIYLDELVSGGVLGFIFLILLYGIILFGLFRKVYFEINKEGFLYIGLFAGLLSFLIQGLMFFQTALGWVIVAILAAFVSNHCFKDKKGKKFTNKINKKFKPVFLGFIIIIFFTSFNYVFIKPFNMDKNIYGFFRMPYEKRLEFYKELDRGYIGNTNNLGNIFIPFHEKLNQAYKAGMDKESINMAINEIKSINVILDNGLKKEHYMDMKLLMSIVGLRSSVIALLNGQERQDYYNQSIFYVQKMNDISSKNPLVKLSKDVLDISLLYGDKIFNL
jgi:O-antigen ligase